MLNVSICALVHFVSIDIIFMRTIQKHFNIVVNDTTQMKKTDPGVRYDLNCANMH